jgi:hypothetical protein
VAFPEPKTASSARPPAESVRRFRNCSSRARPHHFRRHRTHDMRQCCAYSFLWARPYLRPSSHLRARKRLMARHLPEAHHHAHPLQFIAWTRVWSSAYRRRSSTCGCREAPARGSKFVLLLALVVRELQLDTWLTGYGCSRRYSERCEVKGARFCPRWSLPRLLAI